jgi:uncharacterized protein YxjI
VGESTLIFGDRRKAGAYLVTDPNGAIVARIRHGRGGSFAVEDAAGSAVCSGAAGCWGMSNLWRVAGPTGEPLLTLRKHPFRSTAVVQLERGGELAVEGSIWRRSFQVRDGDDLLLSGVPQTSALSLRPYEYAVRSSERLSVAEVISVVQIWRQIRKRDDVSAAAAASTAVVAAG